MSETNNKFSSVFSNKFITRTYCSILKKAFKKNQYYNLHYVENFEFRDGITFTGYIRKDVPLFGEFRKDNKTFFGFLTNPKRKKPFREFGLFSCSDGYYEFGTFKDEKIIYNPEYPFFGLVTKDGKTTLKEYPLDEMPAIDFYNYKTDPDFLRYILPKDLIRIRFLKNKYGFYYGETKEDNTPCGYGVYFESADNYLGVACGCFDGWYYNSIKVVTNKPYFVNSSYSHLKFGYGNIEIILSENSFEPYTYNIGPRIMLRKCCDGQSRQLCFDRVTFDNLFTMIFHDQMVDIKRTELSVQDYDYKRPFDFDYRIPVFRTNLAILSEIVTGNCAFFKKVIENVDFSHTGMSKAEYLNIITSGNGSAEYARQEEYYDRINAEYKRKEDEQRRLEAERKAEQKRLEQEERQRKLRELKEKERKENEELSRILGADMGKIKSYMSTVFSHALTEWEKYQGGEKCAVRLVSIDYKVENGKLLVTFRVAVNVLESVGVFTYGPSWEDKQGRFHKATTADDARRSARSAVESVKQHAVSELKKELNWRYGEKYYHDIKQEPAPLPKDRISMKVEIVKNSGGKSYQPYGIRVG